MVSHHSCFFNSQMLLFHYSINIVNSCRKNKNIQNCQKGKYIRLNRVKNLFSTFCLLKLLKFQLLFYSCRFQYHYQHIRKRKDITFQLFILLSKSCYLLLRYVLTNDTFKCKIIVAHKYLYKKKDESYRYLQISDTKMKHNTKHMNIINFSLSVVLK